MCNAITKMDTCNKLRSLKWSFGRVMGKFENLNEKIGMMEADGPYEKHGLIAFGKLLPCLDSLEYFDLSENFIEQSGERPCHMQYT